MLLFKKQETLEFKAKQQGTNDCNHQASRVTQEKQACQSFECTSFSEHRRSYIVRRDSRLARGKKVSWCIHESRDNDVCISHARTEPYFYHVAICHPSTHSTHRAKLMCLVLLSQHLVKLRELLFCAGAIPIPALLQYNHDVIKSTTQGASQNSLAKSLDVLQCDGIKHSIKTTAARVKGTQSRGKEHICNHIVSFSHHRNKIDPHYPSFLLASTPVCNKHKRLQTTSVILPTAFFI